MSLHAEPADWTADFLQRYAETYRFSHGRPAAIVVTPQEDAILYLRSGPRSFVRDLYSFDPATGKESVLATADKLLGGGEESLTPEEAARRERMRVAARGIASFQLSKDGDQVLLPISGRLFVLNRQDGKVTELKSDAGDPLDPQFSPGGKSIACVRDGDLYVIDVSSGAERRLTTGGGGLISHGLAEFVAQEEMNRMHGFWWSPDSKKIAYQETDETGVEELFISDPANPSKPPQSWRYPRPGRANAAVRLAVVSVEGGAPRQVEWDREQFPYLAAVTWAKGAPFTIVVQNRRQTEELILAVDDRTGVTRELHRERDDVWLNLVDEMPRWIDDGKSFLWMTERGGAWQLELRGPTGDLLGTLTTPELGLRGIVAVHEDRNEAIVVAGENPTEVQLYRVSLDPQNPHAERITTESGIHGGVWAADGGGIYVHSFANLRGENRLDVCRSDGEKIGTLPSVAEAPGFVPNVTIERVSADPELYAAITRPLDFNKNKQYPVIVSVYGGPHAQTVVSNSAKYLLDQWLAEHGFIVVSIDGRGTPSRGREFERAIHGDFITLPLKDQVAGLKALAKQHPEMDLDRVGIHGWSFGGYFTAMALLQQPELFRVGVAGAPVVDWADYDTHYTERYLGLPDENIEGYRRSNVLTYADRLAAKLLLVHGTADDNVYFQHSVKLADALFRAGQPFEFLPLRGMTHMTPEPLVNERLHERMIDHFQRYLQPQDDAAEGAASSGK
ncbi:S9 family peptidase [Lacipirellula parvula]|uniref:S9 family peptidase n=1 Tax=Lacipirellula parvula TaxID=2650471 RepID=UPI001562C2D9|nr:S9 family peptidase [Lacipirellula parvula]